MVDILQPFAEATDLVQGSKSVTISCVVPVVLSLRKFLMEKLEKVRVFAVMVRTLLQSLDERFHGLLTDQLDINTKLKAARDLSFDDDVFLLAFALDPNFGFHWLQDHPGTDVDKETLRRRITGNFYC
jgi:hypothetical protein